MEATNQKCACTDCVCIVDVKDAVKKGDHSYCSQACADGYPKGACCEDTDCVCHG